MKTATERSDRRPMRATTLLLCGMTIANANALQGHASSQRFQIDARAIPQQSAQTGSGFDLRAVMPADRSNAGGGFSLTASALASPYACAGDTIFADGFDP